MEKIKYTFEVGDMVRGNGHRYPSMIIEKCNINGINYYHLDGVNKAELFKEDDLCLVEYTREKVNISLDTGDIITLRNGHHLVMFTFNDCDEWVAVDNTGHYGRSRNYSNLKNINYSDLDIIEVYRLKDRIDLYDIVFNLSRIDNIIEEKRYCFEKIYDERTDEISSVTF